MNSKHNIISKSMNRGIREKQKTKAERLTSGRVRRHRHSLVDEQW